MNCNHKLGIIKVRMQSGIIEVRLQLRIAEVQLFGDSSRYTVCALIGYPDVTSPNENHITMPSFHPHSESEYETFILAENNNIFLVGGPMRVERVV